MKRQRGRGRKPGGGGGGHYNNNQAGHHPNRTLESNGPEGKVRGPAAVIYERYLQLGRDSSSAGDRVLAENFLQHADHYFRLYRASQPASPLPQERSFNEAEYESEDEGPIDAEPGPAERGSAGDEQRDTEVAQGAPQSAGGERDRGEGDFRRRRGRRNRFRPGDGGEEGEAREARAPREPREPGDREPREPREAGPNSERRERGREQGEARERDDGPEGFSGGPRPAFLRQD